MERRPSVRLPEPVDPAEPPKRLLRLAAAVILGGACLLVLGATAAAKAAQANDPSPLVPPEAFLLAWLMSLPVAGLLLVAYRATARRRLRRYERRAGFLPRSGRKELPATGRRTLYRLEYGSRGERICLMIARWNYSRSSGWRRGRVVEAVWERSDDAVAIGEQRARLTVLAERLEEQMDDARLDGERERRLADERLGEQRATSARSDELAQQLARDSR